MGPITLFDKSFLQSLSLDESVWFDAFFTSVICPVFYVETLANLAKAHDDRTADNAVRIIAQKSPEMAGSPCAFHMDMAAHNLVDYQIPMDGRIPRGGGRYVRGGGRIGVVYDESPEMEAFSRWQQQRFLDVERLFAADWRNTLEESNLDEIAKSLRVLGIDGKTCKSLEQAKALAQAVVDGVSKPYERLGVAVRYFGVPPQYQSILIQRWKGMGRPVLSKFAPYAAYVLTIEIFFHIAVAANLISANRPSNRTDIAYLFYLPFCMMFVSSDKLHRRTAKLFMRADQEFVWGPDLKADLKRLNEHYLKLPDEEREKGILQIAHHPPINGDFLTTILWRKWMGPGIFSERDFVSEMDSEKSEEIAEEVKAFAKGETLAEIPHPLNDDALEAMSIERNVHRQKGSWYLVPKDLPDPDSE